MTLMAVEDDAVLVGNDTSKNYDHVWRAVDECNMSGTDVLNMMAHIYGLQLFTEQNTIWLLEELGYEEE